MSYDKLIEIPSSEWSKLRDMYKINWPYHMIGYYTVDNYVRWIEREPKMKNLKFYSLNGDWSDATFLIVDRYHIFLNTINTSLDRLTKILSLFDWTFGYEIGSFLERHRPAVLKAIELNNLPIEYDVKTVTFYMAKEKVTTLEINCPSDLSIKPLRIDHAENVNNVWPYRKDGSLFSFRRLIAWNPHIGIFNKDNKLLAWCLRSEVGSLGAMHVHEDYRRKGLGTLVLKAISKKISTEFNEDIFANVLPENISSVRTFERVGFCDVGYTYWIGTYPLVEAGALPWTNNNE